MRFEQEADGVRIGVCEQNRRSVRCELVAPDGVLGRTHGGTGPGPVAPRVQAAASAPVTSRVVDGGHGRQLAERVDEDEPFNVEFAGCDDGRANSKVKGREVRRRDGRGGRRAGDPHAVDLLFVVVQFVLGNLVQYFDAIQALGCCDEASGPEYAVSILLTKTNDRTYTAMDLCSSPYNRCCQFSGVLMSINVNNPLRCASAAA